jgi:F-type H+-transporting ATPase subunit gamma
MAGAKEIRTKIGSIQNTQKITRAMEMVAASKMRKAKDRMQAARPYAEKMRNVIAHVAAAKPEYKHSYLLARDDVKRVGYIVVSSDRGLCGGLNSNLFRMLIREVDANRSNNIDMDFCIIGNKGASFFRRFGVDIVAQATHLGDAPAIEDLIGTAKAMLDAYREERIDRLYLAYNHFVNTMTQRPSVEQLLPREPSTAEEVKHYWDYIYEPDAKLLLDQLMNRYIESLVYQGVVENGACEQAARMVAMKSASDNAGELISELQLVYNKARQAAITQELSEIVAGAAAV